MNYRRANGKQCIDDKELYTNKKESLFIKSIVLNNKKENRENLLLTKG